MQKLPCLFATFCLLFASLTGSAQVKINEYSAANWQQFYDNHSDFEDWIELYNPANTAVDISGYWLSDDPANAQKFQLPAGTLIQPNGFLQIWCSGRNKVEDSGTNIHTNFHLTQTKNKPETILVSSAAGVILDSVAVEKTAVHQSRCRTTDGDPAWKICTTPTPSATNDGSTQFDVFADRPDMDQKAGFYDTPVTVTITTTEPGGIIHYTLDGHEPTLASAVYTQPLTISQTTVVKARTFSPNPAVLPSFIRFNTYLIHENFTLAVCSVAADTLLELANGDKPLRPVGSIEYFGIDKKRKSTSYGELNSHGQDSWINPQRSLDWISRDEMGYSKDIGSKLFNYSTRNAYQRVTFRAAGDDNYPGYDEPAHQGACHLRDDYCQTLAKTGGLNLDVRASERCILFLNGQYWGVYSLREQPDDHDYTDYYYNQGKYDIQFLETWGDTWTQYGGEPARQDWNNLRKFILNNDMGVPANYQRVKDSIDVLSMIDYFVVNLNVVTSDWLNYNTGWWRGLNPAGGHKKWGYILWDLDATFNYYINYSGVPNTNYDAQPCDLNDISNYVENQFFQGLSNDSCLVYGVPPDTFTYCIHADGKHQVILLKLIQENPEFRQLYYAREADMMNSVFSCENMLHVLDSMAAVLAPEMPRHIGLWGGSLQEWQQNIQTMRDYISQRCDYLKQGMLNCYQELTGPYPVTLVTDPPGAGTIDFNTLNIKNFPWTGNYFGGMDNTIKATPYGTMMFNHWESRAGNLIAPNVTTAAGTISLLHPDTLVAVFSPVSSTTQPEAVPAFRVFPTITSNRINAEFELPAAAPVRLTLYSVLGEPVATRMMEQPVSGKQSLSMDLHEKQLPSGVYLLEMSTGKYKSVQKIILMQ